MNRALYKTVFLLLIAVPLLQGCLLAVAGAGVAAGVGVAHDRRDASTVFDDRRLALRAGDAINRDKAFVSDGNFVHSVVYNGSLLLCGQVGSVELKQRAQTLVEHLDGIKRVVNEIEVTDDPIGFWHRRADNTMTARVKTALLNITSIKDFDPSRVNVTTVNNVVYLMGLVSREEADAVADIARNVAGVAKVVKVFEYTNG
ncbi:MAG: BON domain-containing protein [Rudaea sp.]|uniref:BON domain-containing protein n=1 Tax=unclassified Rudaea TaxID=2627037 RepID=UPI0010F583AA|nr:MULTISPECIES: BON domain-containing protein [unclassified Rudaea]MBN8887338.1 BON domain-containing protein [Rudaea sp.]